MEKINFICGGKTGDLLHNLMVIKTICESNNFKGVLYITNNRGYGGDYFHFDIEKTYDDLEPMIMSQDYIESFHILIDGENIVNISFTFDWQRFCSKFKIQISTRLLAGSETGSVVKLQAVLYLTPNGAKTDLNHYFHTGADSCKLNLIHLDSLFYL